MRSRIEPSALTEYADQLRNATSRLLAAQPPPKADAGRSSGAVASAVAELLRSSAGLAEITMRAADDLANNQAVYCDPDESPPGEVDSRGPVQA